MLDQSLNLQVSKGEQDPSNKISYTEWMRDSKDYIVSHGKNGRCTIAILEWLEQMNKFTCQELFKITKLQQTVTFRIHDILSSI